MNKFYNMTMGPLPQNACTVFSIRSYLELLNLVIMFVIFVSLMGYGKIALSLVTLLSIAVVIVRYVSTRLLFNMCTHRQ